MASGAATGGEVLRFLGAGTVNTLVSIAVYQAALFICGPAISYGVAYAVGIVFGWYAYSRHVFSVPLSLWRLARFAVFYVASLIAGAWLNAGFVEWLGAHPRLAIFATIAVMLPVNYAGSRWCLRPPHQAGAQ